MTENQKSADGKEIALEARTPEGARLFSPSVARNREPLLAAFGELLPDAKCVLEIGSGTGEHGAFLCQHTEGLFWQPSDPDPTSRNSIAAWAETVSGARMAAPLDLRADQPDWTTALPAREWDTLVSINMIHIAPFGAAEGVFAGAGMLLPGNGHLFLYGPFGRNGVMAESNQRFDADLKRRDPRWGVRDLDRDLVPLAQANGLALSAVKEMPANNLCTVFKKI